MSTHVHRAVSLHLIPFRSEVERVRQHAAFTCTHTAGRVRQSPPETMHITHVRNVYFLHPVCVRPLTSSQISAHFRSFAAYSTGRCSVVILGRVLDGGRGRGGPVQQPVIVPELQDRGVTSVVLGDWHYGAVTADGQLLTWGAHGNGALGYPTKELEVAVPTKVRFDYGERQQGKRFCVAATAAGWQTGVLVIDLEVGRCGFCRCLAEADYVTAAGGRAGNCGKRGCCY